MGIYVDGVEVPTDRLEKIDTIFQAMMKLARVYSFLICYPLFIRMQRKVKNLQSGSVGSYLTEIDDFAEYNVSENHFFNIMKLIFFFSL